MVNNLGLPYMGSKRKIAKSITSWILMHNPNCKYVYDLFGGGGAVSFSFMQYAQVDKVFYNELNTGVVELLRDVINNGVSRKYYQWVDRDTFNTHKNDNDWFGGLCKVVWSFGNNQSSYLFGKDIENYKRIFHNAVVFNDLSEIKSIFPEFTQFPASCKAFVTDRRLFISKLVREARRNSGLLEDSPQLEQLERLQQLEQLQRLQPFENLTISNLSYNEVVIDTQFDETIVYLDPPYFKTTKYQNKINHDDLWNWIRKSKYKVYFSSYDAPDDFNLEFGVEHRSTLCATKNNKVVEKLYSNNPQI